MTPSPLSDEDLVEGALGGEEDAFSQLYERYRRPVYATAYRIMQNTQEAQDATQEIFIKLHRSLRSWNPGKARFSTWLYRLATNHAIDCWRLRRRREQGEGGIGAAAEERFKEHSLRDAIRSPYRQVHQKEQIEEIRRSIEGLPELQKKVFILRYFQELKLEEIAAIEECSLGTVKTSLFRATHTVRRAFRKTRTIT